MAWVLTYVASNSLVLLFAFYNVPSYKVTYDFAIDIFNNNNNSVIYYRQYLQH